MPYSRECFVATGKKLGSVHIAPVVEAWVWLDDSTGLRSCVAGVRPLGFAVLTPERGYWLTGPAAVEELARAVYPQASPAQAS